MLPIVPSLLLSDIADNDSAYCDSCYCSVVSVTLVHPAKAVARNEIPLDRDTRVIQSNIVLNGAPEGEI